MSKVEKSIGRRRMIQGGLFSAATLPFLLSGSATAQARYTWHQGYRLLAHEDRVFGLGAVGVRGDDIRVPSPSAFEYSEISGSREREIQIAKLLQASRNGEPLTDIPYESTHPNRFMDEIGVILESEPEVTNLLNHPDTRFSWVQTNPVFIIIIGPHSPAAWAAGTALAGTVALV